MAADQTVRSVYLEAFELAAGAFKPHGFAPVSGVEPAVALYLMVGHGLSVDATAASTGWCRAEVVEACTLVDMRCANDSDFELTVRKLVRRMASILEQPA
jgi:hypothetical protein